MYSSAETKEHFLKNYERKNSNEKQNYSGIAMPNAAGYTVG